MTTAGPGIGRSHPAAAGRMVLCLGTMLLAALIVLAGAAGPAYGRTRRAGFAAQLGSRLLLRALGIRIARTGAVRDGAVLVVANHVSWVDILAITATAPASQGSQDRRPSWFGASPRWTWMCIPSGPAAQAPNGISRE